MALYPGRSRSNVSDDDLLADQMTSGRLSPGHDLGYHTLVTRSPTPNAAETVVIDEDYRSVLLFKRQQQQAASWSESGCSSPRSSFLQRGAGLEIIEDTERLVATFKVGYISKYLKNCQVYIPLNNLYYCFKNSTTVLQEHTQLCNKNEITKHQ